MFYFYVLYSLKDEQLYKGYSKDPDARLLKHNRGGSRSTKNRRPFLLIYSESFATKREALERERWSKTLEGGSELKDILVTKGILDIESKLKTSPSE